MSWGNNSIANCDVHYVIQPKYHRANQPLTHSLIHSLSTSKIHIEGIIFSKFDSYSLIIAPLCFRRAMGWNIWAD